jgi:hypothetical protein
LPDEAFNTALAGWRRSLTAHMADETVSKTGRQTIGGKGECTIANTAVAETP